jgi:hypothetical protein
MVVRAAKALGDETVKLEAETGTALTAELDGALTRF